MTTYEIDGTNFSTLEGFYDEISQSVIPSAAWGRNLDAFNDILRGGFGTPANGFTLRWKNHDISRHSLGYRETVRQLEKTLQRCHPTNRNAVRAELDLARANQGPTVFDWLLEIIAIHSEGGEESEDNVQLDLA